MYNDVVGEVMNHHQITMMPEDARKNKVSLLKWHYEILSSAHGFGTLCSVQAAHAVGAWKSVYGFIWSFHFSPLCITMRSHIKQVPFQ